MSQIIQKLDQQQLKSLCGIVAHTSEGLTKSELTTLLGQCGICAVDDGSSRNQLGYTIGLNKRDWLYNCLVTEINKSQSFSKVFSFLQAVLNPAAYTSADSRQKYRYLFEETNKVLLFAGLSIDQSGRLVAVSQAETLSEVDQRVNQLKKALLRCLTVALRSLVEVQSCRLFRTSELTMKPELSVPKLLNTLLTTMLKQIVSDSVSANLLQLFTRHIHKKVPTALWNQ